MTDNAIKRLARARFSPDLLFGLMCGFGFGLAFALTLWRAAP